MAKPKIGDTVDGYKFLGGDPNKEASWGMLDQSFVPKADSKAAAPISPVPTQPQYYGDFGKNIGQFFGGIGQTITKDIPAIASGYFETAKQAGADIAAPLQTGSWTERAGRVGGGALGTLAGLAGTIPAVGISLIDRISGGEFGQSIKEIGEKIKPIADAYVKLPGAKTLYEMGQSKTPAGQANVRALLGGLQGAGLFLPSKVGTLDLPVPKTLIGAPMVAAGKGLVEAAAETVPAKLHTAIVQLFEKAPVDIKAKLGGSTYADKLDVLTKNIKQYGLDNYAANGPKLEEVTHDLAHQAIKKADAELMEKGLGISPQPEARPGSVYDISVAEGTKINPWQVVEKAVKDQIALKSKGSFPTEDLGR